MDFDFDANPGITRVLAHFGFAVAKAQVVERLLAALVVYPDLVRLQTQGERDKALQKAHGASLGALRTALGALRQQFPGRDAYPDLCDDVLKEVADARNMAVHRFFWEDHRTAMLNTSDGQAELVTQLHSMWRRFDEVETHLRRIVPLDFEYSSDPSIAPRPRVSG
jgi:hypothetical protein